MATKAELSGKMVQLDAPNWDPILRLLDSVLVERMMWMSEIELEDGTTIHCYKDRYTRRHLHLADDGRRAFYYTERDRYRDLDTGAAVINLYAGACQAGRLDEVEEAALRLVLAKLDRGEEDESQEAQEECN